MHKELTSGIPGSLKNPYKLTPICDERGEQVGQVKIAKSEYENIDPCDVALTPIVKVEPGRPATYRITGWKMHPRTETILKSQEEIERDGVA